MNKDQMVCFFWACVTLSACAIGGLVAWLALIINVVGWFAALNLKEKSENNKKEQSSS